MEGLSFTRALAWTAPGTGQRDARRNRVTHHFCPTCEQPYGCPRGEEGCRSPHIYDCYYCYARRHRKELSALLTSVTARFGDDQSCAGYGDFCFAH